MKSSELPALKLFVLLLFFSILFSYMNLEKYFLVLLSVAGFLAGLLLIKFRKNQYAYIFWVATLGLLTSQRFDVSSNNFPNKIIPEQKAIFSGKVTQIVKSDKKYIRYFAEGKLDSEELPAIEKTRIILTVVNPKFALMPGEYFISNINVKFPEANLPNEKFDYSAYYNSNDVQWSAITYGKNITKIAQVDELIYYSTCIRMNISKKIFQVFDSTSAAIFNALITGDKSLIDSETRRNYSLTGTAHLLAVSGLHVGIISFIIYTLFSFITNQLFKTVSVIAILTCFVFMTGWLDSALRAALMISVYLISLNFEQKVNPLNSLSIAALIMFLWNPDIIYSISFRMSFLSVSGIILFYDRFFETFKKLFGNSGIAKFAGGSLSLTLASSVIISPIVAYYFDVFSIISPIANFLAVPLMMLAMSLGISALFFSVFSESISSVYAAGAGVPVNLTELINSYSSGIPFSYIEGYYSGWAAIVFTALMIYLVYSNSKRHFIFRFSASMIMLFFFILLIPKEMQSQFQIVPRQNMTSVFLKKDSTEYLLLFDRMPENTLRSDFGIKNHIINTENKLIAGYTGNSSIATIDEAKKDKKIISFHLDIKTQNELSKLLKFKEHPVKIIDLK